MKDNYYQLKEASDKITGRHKLSDELLHYAIDEFLHKPKVDDIVASGGGRFYIVRIMMTQWRSTTGPFFHTYMKGSDSITEEVEAIPEEQSTEDEATAAKIKAELAKLPWFDRRLFEIYIQENHTVSSLARATEIPRTTISLAINRIKKHIRKTI
jgi:hypothetical protein